MKSRMNLGHAPFACPHARQATIPRTAARLLWVMAALASGSLAILACNPAEPPSAVGGSSSAEQVGLPDLVLAGAGEAECDERVGRLSLADVAALPHAWFHGEIVDVYPETEMGTTVTFQRSAGYEGDLFQRLDTCSGVIPQLLIEVEIHESIGGSLPERVIFAMDKTWLANRPIWDGYTVYSWDGSEGGAIAPGQRIGGAADAVSSRYERAALYARPLFPLFIEGSDGLVRFQRVVVESEEADSDCGAPAPTFYPELETHSPESLLGFIAAARAGDTAPQGEDLAELRRSVIGGVDDRNTDVWSGVYFPHCTPADFEHARVEHPTGVPDPPIPNEE